MYLRFRNSQISAANNDGAFDELYQKIHGKLPKPIKPNRKPNFKVQVYLVKSQWINGRSKQIYIGVLASVKVYIDKNKQIILDDKIKENIQKGFVNNNVPLEKQKPFLKKIENYFSSLESSKQ